MHDSVLKGEPARTVFSVKEIALNENADPEIVAEAGPWNEVTSKPEFRARKREDGASYWWGELRKTAEDRFTRRALGRACSDWLQRREAGE